MHGTDERQVIDMPGQVRHGIGNPHATLPMPGEPERAAHQRAGTLRAFHLASDLVEVFFTMMLVEERLGIEQIHLAGAAGLKACGGISAQTFFLAEQPGEGRPGNATGNALEPIPAGHRPRQNVFHLSHACHPFASTTPARPRPVTSQPQSTYKNPAEFSSA